MTDKIAEDVADFLRYRLGNYEYYKSLRNIEHTLKALADLGYEVVKVSEPKDPPIWPVEFKHPNSKSYCHQTYINSFNEEY